MSVSVDDFFIASLVIAPRAAILPTLNFVETVMALDIKSGQNVRVTIKKQITRASARKTLERLFLTDQEISDPIERRSGNFKELPKRRGGCIWTKRANKLHPTLAKGESASVKLTPQFIRDLGSVEAFVEVA
jgi:hypothetical protein